MRAKMCMSRRAQNMASRNQMAPMRPCTSHIVLAETSPEPYHAASAQKRTISRTLRCRSLAITPAPATTRHAVMA